MRRLSLILMAAALAAVLAGGWFAITADAQRTQVSPQMSIDPAEPADVLQETLVHELAHLITLRSDDLVTDVDHCDGVRIEIGCARAGSVLAGWAGEFWPGVTEPAPFDRHVFVTDYAASAVHEDLAESFLAYVQRTGAPTEPVIAAKFAFFDAHAELAAAADELRARSDG